MTRAGNLAELRRLAEAATPGPWWFGYENINYRAWVTNADVKNIKYVLESAPMKLPEQSPPYKAVMREGFAWHNDLEYIAAANPATILALLSLHQDAIALLRAIHEPCSYPGCGDCAEINRIANPTS